MLNIVFGITQPRILVTVFSRAFTQTMSFIRSLIMMLAISMLTMARRRYYYAAPIKPTYKDYQEQSARIAKMLANPRISILDEETLLNVPSSYYHHKMCPYFRNVLYKDKTWIQNKIMVPLTTDKRDEFAKEWMSVMYTKPNFPHTHRTDSVYLDTSIETFDRDVWNYYLHHCAPEEEKWETEHKNSEERAALIYGFMTIITFIIIIGIITNVCICCTKFAYGCSSKCYNWIIAAVLINDI